MTRLCRCLLQMRSMAFFQISVSTGSLRLWEFKCKWMAWKFILPIQLAIENPSVATVASLFWRFGPHICTRQSIRIFRTMSGRPNAIQGTGCQWRWGSLLNLKMISGGCEGFAFVCVVEAWRMSSWGWDSVVAAVICVLISHLNNGATCLDKWSKLCVGCEEKVATCGYMIWLDATVAFTPLSIGPQHLIWLQIWICAHDPQELVGWYCKTYGGFGTKS